jgi:hypothetical protein
LVTCFLSVDEQPEREFSSALRCTAWVVMSMKLPGALVARRELVRREAETAAGRVLVAAVA